MSLSIVIPTHNEENQIAETIRRVRRRAKDDSCDIIVVDGGSVDQTVTIARKAGARVLTAPQKGRAAQMNYGARKAGGRIFYFLHADSIPPPDFDAKIKKAVREGFRAGCFRLKFDADHFLLNCYAWFTRFDIDAFRFGDQSLFVTRSVFRAIKGFREDHKVMEDHEIVCRIKQQFPFKLMEEAVTTSARKYRRIGILKLQMIFITIFSLYKLGFKQESLVFIYRKLVR